MYAVCMCLKKNSVYADDATATIFCGAFAFGDVAVVNTELQVLIFYHEKKQETHDCFFVVDSNYKPSLLFASVAVNEFTFCVIFAITFYKYMLSL